MEANPQNGHFGQKSHQNPKGLYESAPPVKKKPQKVDWPLTYRQNNVKTEAAQLLRTLLTDWHTSEVFKDFGTRALIEAKPQYGTKWRLLNISGPCWLINTKTSPCRHFWDILYMFLRIEAIRPPWRPILKMAIWGQNGTKTQKAYRKVHHLWRNNLKKLIGLWDIDKTL